MLGIAERAVHDRAHAALAVLAPARGAALEPGRREEIGEYLLGQQATERRAAAHAHAARDLGACQRMGRRRRGRARLARRRSERGDAGAVR